MVIKWGFKERQEIKAEFVFPLMTAVRNQSKRKPIWGETLPSPASIQRTMRTAPSISANKKIASSVKTITLESEKLSNKHGWLFVSDNRRERVFTVTFTNLTVEDTGVYWCGGETTVYTTLITEVELTVNGECKHCYSYHLLQEQYFPKCILFLDKREIVIPSSLCSKAY